MPSEVLEQMFAQGTERVPRWPSRMRGRLADGRCFGTDESVWLYMKVPLAPVVDAVTAAKGDEVAEPILLALQGLADITNTRFNRRGPSKGNYRQFHTLLVNVPKQFKGPAGSPIAGYLEESFPDAVVDRRVLLFGVKLKASLGTSRVPAALGGPGAKMAVRRVKYRAESAIDSLAESLVTASTPITDYDDDFNVVHRALADSGLRPASDADIALADAWWNHGRNADTPYLEHVDHMHMFMSSEALATAARHGTDADECPKWPNIPHSYSLAFGCVNEIPAPIVSEESDHDHWVSELLRKDVQCVSIRGKVEPAKVTRNEIRNKRRVFREDEQQRQVSGQMGRIEQEDMLAQLGEAEAVYATDEAPATTTEVRILLARTGKHPTYGHEMEWLSGRSNIEIATMATRQRLALNETMLCSPVRAVPHVHDLPSTTIAYSGMPSLSIVGDRDGALLGFTELDKQPALVSPEASSKGDAEPLFIIPGTTGPQPLDTQIPVPVSHKYPGGWAKFGDLQVGDRLFTPTGTTHVAQLHPIRKLQVYLVHTADGQTVRCGPDHLWKVAPVGDDTERIVKARDLVGGEWRIQAAESIPGRHEQTADWLKIDTVEAADAAVPMRCISVDHESGMYLTDSYIPTHNSGKSVAAIWLADQFAQIGTPTIFVDPKEKSDFEPAVRHSGGDVRSLDDLITSEGIFDPMLFMGRNASAGASIASSVLMTVNPWGNDQRQYEVPLKQALSYGINNGATCTGEALKMALKAGQAPRDMVEKVLKYADIDPMFRAMVGMKSGTQGLYAADGLTLIKVGTTHLELPDPNSTADPNLDQRVAMALVRMMVFGSAMALTAKNGGVTILDEAWVFLMAGTTEVQRLGRLARSQGVLPILLTQKITDALAQGIETYVSRGLILPVKDDNEARAACDLFKLDPNHAGRLQRITAKAHVGGDDSDETGTPNWDSMRALRDPETKKVLRGTIGIYVDLYDRAVPVEITIPPEFFKLASTNPDDIKARKAEEARKKAQAEAKRVDAEMSGAAASGNGSNGTANGNRSAPETPASNGNGTHQEAPASNRYQASVPQPPPAHTNSDTGTTTGARQT